jgi:hypothetical protein
LKEKIKMEMEREEKSIGLKEIVKMYNEEKKKTKIRKEKDEEIKRKDEEIKKKEEEIKRKRKKRKG